MINVACLCGKKFRAKPELAGRRVACPACGETFVVTAAQPAGDDPFVVDLDRFEEAPAADPLGIGAEPAPPSGYSPMAGSPAADAYPQPLKRRRRSAGNTGKYVAWAFGVPVILGAIAGLVILVMHLLGSPHERMVRKMLKLTERICIEFESIKDVESADRAAEKLKPLLDKFAAAITEARAMDKPSPAVERRLQKYEDRKQKLNRRVLKAVGDLRAKPHLQRRLADTVKSSGLRSLYGSR